MDAERLAHFTTWVSAIVARDDRAGSGPDDATSEEIAEVSTHPRSLRPVPCVVRSRGRHAVVRFDVDGVPRCWLKVTSPLSIEPAVTRLLADARPDAIAPPIADDRASGAFVTRHVPGTPLHRLRNRDAWCEAARTLARIQRAAAAERRGAHGAPKPGAPHAQESGGLNALPALHDESMASMRVWLPCLRQSMIDATHVRPAGPPLGLDAAAIARLLDGLDAACVRLSACPAGAARTLCHPDPAPHNVIIAPGRRAVWLDWSEPTLGHPFIPLEHLAAKTRKDYPWAAGWIDDMRSAYAGEWQDALPPDDGHTGFSPSPLRALWADAELIAIAVYTRRRCLDAPFAEWPASTAARFRGFARLMHRTHSSQAAT